MNSINIEGKLWINFRYPNCKVADVDYIMKIFNFPQISQRYIFDNWIRINEKNGGTYCEPTYFKSLPTKHYYKRSMI